LFAAETKAMMLWISVFVVTSLIAAAAHLGRLIESDSRRFKVRARSK
jgi:hypothetical protein